MTRPASQEEGQNSGKTRPQEESGQPPQVMDKGKEGPKKKREDVLYNTSDLPGKWITLPGGYLLIMITCYAYRLRFGLMLWWWFFPFTLFSLFFFVYFLFFVFVLGLAKI